MTKTSPSSNQRKHFSLAAMTSTLADVFYMGQFQLT